MGKGQAAGVLVRIPPLGKVGLIFYIKHYEPVYLLFGQSLLLIKFAQRPVGLL